MSNQVNDENVGLLKQLVTTVQKKNDKEKVDNSIKMKLAKVIGVDEDTYKVFVYFIDDIEQNAYTFYNKSGEVLSEGDNVRVYYTTNPAKGWIGARCGETNIKQFENAGNGILPLTEYKYLADNSVKFNGVTYTVEKDSATGLISKISDSGGNEFEPTVNSGITDTALHNAVFWAVAMCRGLPNPPNIVELYNAGNEYAGITGGWFKSAEIMRAGYSTVSMTKQASYIELTSEMYYTTNAHDHNAFIAAGTLNKVDVTDYSKIVAEFDCEGTNKKGRAEFVIYVTGSYNVNQWLYTDIVMKYVYSPPANSDYSEIGLVLSTDKIASLTGAYYISFGFGGTNAERKGSCKLKRVYLER